MKSDLKRRFQLTSKSHGSLGVLLVAGLFLAMLPAAIAQADQQEQKQAKNTSEKAAQKDAQGKKEKPAKAKDEARKKATETQADKKKKAKNAGKEQQARTDQRELGVLLAPTPSGSPLVLGVRRGSPAQRAGIRHGDFILSLDGKEVSSPDKLQQRLKQTAPDQTAKITVWRNGEESTHEVRFEAPIAQRPWLGAMIRPAPEGGVRIARIFLGSPAEEAGLEPGDRVIRVGETDISSPQGFIEQLRQTEPGQKVKLQIMRGGEEQTVEIQMGNLEDFHERMFGERFRGRFDDFQGMPDSDFDGVPDRILLFRFRTDEPVSLREALAEMRAELRELRRERLREQATEGETPTSIDPRLEGQDAQKTDAEKEKSESKRAEGKRAEGKEVEGKKAEGKKADGKKTEGKKAEKSDQ